VKPSCTCLIRASAVFVCALTFCTPLLAQEPQFDDLAKDMTDALVKSKQYKVAVVDFLPADDYKTSGDMSDVGRKLADDFRAALLRRNHEIITEDRESMMYRLRTHGLTMENLRDTGAITWVFGDSGLDAWVAGELSGGVGGLKVKVKAYQVGKYFPEYEGETSIPFTAELKALVREKPPNDFPLIARPGENGVTYPACLYCPQASYSDEAVKAKIQGKVVLDVTIDETGKAKDIKVRAGLPAGLTEQAVEAVTKKWRLKPAVDAKGNPVAVRETLEITFHLY
jgi:TonB family protein